MPSGLVMVDHSGAITGFNPASERIFGGTLQLEASLPDLVRESETLQDLLQKCLSTGEIFTRMQFNVPVSPDLDKRIGINLSPFTNAEGAIEGVICLLSDLTEIVELQNQIKLKENFAALGEMSAGIAHEFKNSLATILGYAQMSGDEADPEALRSYCGRIYEESRKLSVLVTDFLNFAKPMDTLLVEVDLRELLEAVILDARHLRPGDYHIDFRDKRANSLILGDTTLIRQAFFNLLLNGIEALDQQRDIAVSIEEAPRNQIRIVFEDSGCGIPPHIVPKIFVPFFTTKARGTGLGLALVQKIILAHNGRIEVHSTPGKGTRFAVTLPGYQR
jgi:signal transduction histidine kinase